MDKICTVCGHRYYYNPSEPRGATSFQCPACQKKQGRTRKLVELMLIAGNGDIQCRCCGYRKFTYAIKMAEGRAYLEPPDDITKARTSFLICLNCAEAVKAGDIQFKILDATCYPIKMEFFETRVSIEESPLQQHLKERSDDAIEMEVYRGEQKNPIRSVSAANARLEGGDS